MKTSTKLLIAVAILTWTGLIAYGLIFDVLAPYTLTQKSERRLRWGKGSNVKIFFDNGTATAITIRLGPEQEFEVPAGDYRIVESPVCKLNITAMDAKSGRVLDEIEQDLEPNHGYVYNPEAQCEHKVVTAEYRPFAGYGPGPTTLPLPREVFFDAGEIDFVMELPKVVEDHGGKRRALFRVDK